MFVSFRGIRTMRQTKQLLRHSYILLGVKNLCRTLPTRETPSLASKLRPGRKPQERLKPKSKMDTRISVVLLACMICFAKGIPLPTQGPNTIIGSFGINEFRNFVDTFGRSAPIHKGKNESFNLDLSKITQGNKDSNFTTHEGDIVQKSGRSATPNAQSLWPKSSLGTVNVPYILSSVYNAQQLALFTTAMQEFETLTCVRFIPRTTETDYINIVSSLGCASYIGKVGGGQPVYLSADVCMIRGMIQHELSHTIGFLHEHTRSDRDNYVNIITQNIAPGQEGNFVKYNSNNLGLEYDYSSVMHFPRDAFSYSPGQDTIVPKPNPNVPIGQLYGLSILDVSKINKLYNCRLCANLLNDMTGIFTSANYPSIYPNNVNCTWLIRTPAGQVALQFAAFDVQYSSTCSYDYMRIYDGPSRSSPVLLDRTCGTGQVPLMVASTNQMLVEFISDGATAGIGFKANYVAIQCGGAFYAASKTFSSPGYPTNYYSDLDCGWIIAAPYGYKITLTIKDFSVQSSPLCSYDSLTVFDGPYLTSPQIGKYCSLSPPPLVSTSNYMLLRFHSDSSVQMRGFQATYVMSPK